MKTPRLLSVVIFCILSLIVGVCPVAAQGTTFTYQGRLNANGVPFDGSAELQFTLWSADSEGEVLATSTPETTIVGVTNGLFTVPLDFGTEPFNGQEYWLEIALRTGSGAFSTLSPRQPINPTPRAIYAAGVSAAGINGTISATNLGGDYDQPVVFSNAANTFIGTFAGDGSGITALNAANLTGSASINTTGNAATATNVNYGGSVTTSNVIVSTPSADLTNSYVFIGYGGIQLPNALYGQGSLGLANTNWRNGIEWWGQGISSPQSWTEWLVQPSAFIHVWDNWGGGASSPGSMYPTMHMGSLGNIRIEAGFGGSAPASSYITLGNEDSNQKLRVNYVTASTTNGADGSGYSLPLYFDSVGIVGGQTVGSGPAIQGWFAGTNGGIWPGDGMTLGELSFLSRGPLPDTDAYTFGRQNPTYHYEVGRMRTNGWWFRGPVNQEQSTVVGGGTNVVLDFNAASAQTIHLVFTTTNRICTTNVNVYGGSTNLEARIFRFLSGANDRLLRWPSEWSIVSESGTDTLPTVLAAQRVLYLKLDSWGVGNSNIVARFWTGPDHSFAYDADATAFLTRAAISNSTQRAAVDYLAKALKENNLWPKIKILYPFIGGNAAAHSRNLISDAYNITWYGAPIQNANGVTGNGSTMYGDTGWTNNQAGAQNSSHLAVYCRTVLPNDEGSFMGAQGLNGHMAFQRSGANLSSYGPMTLHSPLQLGSVSSDFQGFLAVSRYDAYQIYGANRSTIFTSSATATGTPEVSHAILAIHWNDQMHYYGPSSANLALASAGDGLSPAELVTYRSIVDTFETMLGRNVP